MNAMTAINQNNKYAVGATINTRYMTKGWVQELYIYIYNFALPKNTDFWTNTIIYNEKFVKNFFF